MGEAEHSGSLADGGHRLVQRVYFEDTDFSGRVYHARYLHFLERGRSDFLRLLGVHHHALAKDGLAFAVHRMEIEFRRAAAIDDLVTVVTVPLRVTGARIVLSQSIDRDSSCLVEATVSVALIGPDSRPRRLPQKLRATLEGAAKAE